MTTRTAATASLSSFGTSTSSSSSCVFDHANRPTKAEARAVRPRAVSCEVVGPGWVDVCCLSNRVSSQFILFIISEEWSASSVTVCTQQPQHGTHRSQLTGSTSSIPSRDAYVRSTGAPCNKGVGDVGTGPNSRTEQTEQNRTCAFYMKYEMTVHTDAAPSSRWMLR